MSIDVFSAQDSYHEMLQRAQALDPVLTYVLCDLLREVKKAEHPMWQSEKIPTGGPSEHKYSYYFMITPQSDMDRFLTRIFDNFTVCVRLYEGSAILFARKQFVLWLQAEKITFDPDQQFVSLPA